MKYWQDALIKEDTLEPPSVKIRIIEGNTGKIIGMKEQKSLPKMCQSCGLCRRFDHNT